MTTINPRVILALAVTSIAGQLVHGGDRASETAYVWQRDSSPAVGSALARGSSLLDGFHVLAAEVSWTGDEMKTWQGNRDWAAVAVLQRPTGLVLRIGPYAGPFAADDATARQLVEVAVGILADARAGGVEPVELQIDFDCAESKLDGYRAWLLALREAVAPTPLVVTVLPSWMNAREAFARLVAATDGFVLQVHSLERPSGPDAPFVLCDPARARAWAVQAGEFGVPFRVALPTYGYVLTFDADGKFVSLSAEQDARAAPPGGRQRVVLADAVVVADLARELRAHPPPACGGLIWFRLPVDGDQLNWTWPTFAKVVRGETLVRRLVVAIEWPDPALAEIVFVNEGGTTEIVRSSVAVAWPTDAKLVAADALGGFRLETSGVRRETTVARDSTVEEMLLTPGERRQIAWFRFAHATAVDVRLVPSR